MQSTTRKKLVDSWRMTDHAVHDTDELFEWIKTLNNNTFVQITRCSLDDCNGWYLDPKDHYIKHKSGGFFSIASLIRKAKDNDLGSQPIILQNEIGFLGIIAKEIKGTVHFLMQGKIEPGNINRIQLSPTIQATRSNFMQLHKGSRPLYMEYFLNASQYEIVVDQIQSEQSSRFYKKRNRNILILIDCDIEVSPNHRWMTLGQIKEFLKHDNIVNMDTRTVISCIPFSDQFGGEIQELVPCFRDPAMFRSVFSDKPLDRLLFHAMNNAKMFDTTDTIIGGMDRLEEWNFTESGISCKTPSNFEVIFCNIEIEGREIRKWSQPLFMANGDALFGLFTTRIDGVIHFMVRLHPEPGCFDVVELGPTVQLECCDIQEKSDDPVVELFKLKLSNNDGVLYDVMLSEEGGRFYHEQNRNTIISIDMDELPLFPPDCFWQDFGQLNRMIQFNNVANIQLRNLLAIMEI